MKNETLEPNIYLPIHTLDLVPRLLELFSLHIDRNTQLHNGSVSKYMHIILATVMITR
jgi:hypothetical protein